jgi:hypothetical protein
MKTFLHLWQYLFDIFLEWEIFWVKVVEKIKIHILLSATFLRKWCRLRENVEIFSDKGATDNMAYARGILNN